MKYSRIRISVPHYAVSWLLAAVRVTQEPESVRRRRQRGGKQKETPEALSCEHVCAPDATEPLEIQFRKKLLLLHICMFYPDQSVSTLE